MSALANKVAIVTGASSGIGFAAAKLFAREGASIVVAARRQSELDRLVAEIDAAGGRAAALAGDVASEEFAKALVDLAEARFGGLAVGFNNAGTIGELGDISESIENGRERSTLILTSAFQVAISIPAMMTRETGSLLVTSTYVGYTAGFPGTAASAAGESGLRDTQVLA